MPKTDLPPLDDWEGWDTPYYTQVPDALFDRWLPHLSGAELKVLLYIMRRTFGFKKNADTISFSQLTDGIVKHDGTRLNWGAGVARSTAQVAIKGLVEKRLIEAVPQTAPDGDAAPTLYRLIMRARGYAGNRHRGMPISGIPLYRESVTQETVVQETKKQEEDRSDLQNEPEDPPSPKPSYSPVIAGAVLDLAKSLRDELAGPGAVQVALRLWQRSGWSEAAFVAQLQVARGKQRRLSGVLGVVEKQMGELSKE